MIICFLFAAVIFWVFAFVFSHAPLEEWGILGKLLIPGVVFFGDFCFCCAISYYFEDEE